MATSNAKKKTSPKRNTSSSRKSAPQPLTSRQKEILGISIMALATLLLCTVALAPDEGADTNAIGMVSLLLLRLLRFLAGNAALVLPLFLLIFGALLLVGRNRASGTQTLGMIIMLCAFLGMFSLSTTLESFGATMSAAADGAGGGFIGGLLAFLMQVAFGFVGSLILLLAMMVIGLLLFADTSLAELFRKIGGFFSRLNAPDDERATEPAPRRSAHNPRGKKPELIAGASAVGVEDERRRQPLIIMPEDPAPIISDPVEVDPGPPPPPNRFSTEFLPAISAEEEAAMAAAAAKGKRGRKLKVVEEMPTDTEEEILDPAQEQAMEKAAVAALSGEGQATAENTYQLPPINLIEAGIKVKNPRLNKDITESVARLEAALQNFGVRATVTQVTAGPAVTRYELQPAPGVKVAKITNLADDIALALAATGVRIEAPIPGKNAVGIEVARSNVDIVYFREMLDSPEFQNAKSKLSVAFGKNIPGECVVGDLAKMPHLLIAGATGQGKSVCIDSIICSILYKARPDEVKLMLIDPKKVSLAYYNDLPHLVAPVVKDSKKAANALKWVVNEMDNRYSLFVGAGVKDFASFNLANPEDKLPQIVVIIDELADLMMVAKRDVEESICRIAQLARAAGIHLVVATQRPSVDVITGLIKANIPSRIAFKVSSSMDARVVLDSTGAEKLLGRGDMLYSPAGSTKPVRVQGGFIEEKDIERLVAYCTAQAKPSYIEDAVQAANTGVVASGSSDRDDLDELFCQAGRIIIESGQASTSYLQRRLSIGNPRAARLIDSLQEEGVVGGPKGSKPRDILMTIDEFEETFGHAG